MSPGRFSVRCLVAVLAAGVAGACSSVDPSNDTAASLQILTGKTYADTIASLPAIPLSIRVQPPATDSAPRLSGILVTFSADSPGGSFAPPAVFPLGVVPTIPLDQDTTNASGLVSVQVRLGTKAGVSWLRVQVPAFGLKDSVRIMVSPGLPSELSGAPADQILLPGQSSRLTDLRVYDQAGNVRPELPTTRSLAACVTVSGDLVQAVAPCRTTIELAAGTARGQLYVSVPPDLMLSTAAGASVRIHRTNGTVLQTIPIPPFPYFPLSTEWSADGSFLLLDGGGGSLRILEPSGTVREFTDPAYYALYPRFSRDGAWVYYGRQVGPLTWEVRRIHPTGLGDSLLAAAGTISPAPSPSPDGRYVAYIGPTNALRILDLSNGATTDVVASTLMPAWSPVGNEIAAGDPTTGGIQVIRPDGTTLIRFQNLFGLIPPFHWSSDGRWLLGSLGGLAIGIIDRQNGGEISLVSTTFQTAPTWKP